MFQNSYVSVETALSFTLITSTYISQHIHLETNDGDEYDSKSLKSISLRHLLSL